MNDLVVLVSDKNMEHAVSGLLRRRQALAIRAVTHNLFVHPRHDPGCLNEAPGFLRPLSRAYHHALVMFDHEGCGREGEQADRVADGLKGRLQRSGWSDRAEVVVLAPELDVWVWTPSPHVDSCLGWTGRQPPLRDWLVENGFWSAGAEKPDRPKEAMEAALRHVGRPRSSAIYLELAERVSLQGHNDPAFMRLTRALQRWFP